MDIKLINGEKISFVYVLNSLDLQKWGTKWAGETNSWAVERAKKFNQINNGIWYRGLLPEIYFWQILLPAHSHGDTNKDAIFLFPENTSTLKVIDFYKQRDTEYNKECLELLEWCKDTIRKVYIKDPIILGIENNKIYCIDGLHRIIALILLREEGFVYQPIPVMISTRDNVEITKI